MPIVPIRIKDSQKGAVWDTPAAELPPSIFSDAKNVRCIDATLERMGGLKECGAKSNSKALFGISQSGVNKLLLFTDDAIYLTDDADSFSTAVTPSAGIADSATWSVSQIGDNVIATSIDNIPLLLTAGASVFVPFTNWPSTYRCRKLEPFQGYLVAAGIKVSGTEKTGLIKWSNAYDPAALASVAWDHTVLTNLAGEKVIAMDSEIMDFGILRNMGIIYGSLQTHKMTSTTANIAGVPQVFQFELLFEDEGIFGSRCFVEADNNHYVVGAADIYRHNGIQRQSISNGRATEKLVKQVVAQGTTSTISTEIFCGHNPKNSEVYFAYAPGFSGYARRALVYNYALDAWTELDLSATATPVPFTHFANSAGPSSDLVSYAEIQNEYNDLTDSISTYTLASTTDSETTMYVMSPTLNKVYKLDHTLAASTIAPTATIERQDLDLDEYFKTIRNLKYISRTMPIFEGSGTVNVYVGGRNNIAEDVTYGDAQTFTIGTDYKVDHRSTFRFPAIKFEQTDSNDSALTGFDLEVPASYGR